MYRVAAVGLVSASLALTGGLVARGNTVHSSPGNQKPSASLADSTAVAPSTAVTVTWTFRPKPVYPRAALREHIQGCVRVRFNIDRRGRPTDLQVWTHYPSDIFDLAAIETVAQWRFRVTDAAGHRTTVHDVFQEINFDISAYPGTLNWVCHQPPPRTLIAALAPPGSPQAISVTPHGKRVDLITVPSAPNGRLTDGWVKVQFCVDGQGEVTRAKAEDSYPPGLYSEAAIRALLVERFSGRDVRGKPVTTCGLKYEVPVIAESTLEKGPVAIGHVPTAVTVRDLEVSHRYIAFPNGKVVIRFCVEANGSISNVETVKSRSNPLLVPAALNVMRTWEYWPREVDGKPVRTCNVEQTLRFRNRPNLWFVDPGAMVENR